MDPAVMLLILRVISAVVLLLFLGLIGWFIYKDMSLAAGSLPETSRSYGAVQVVSTEAGNLTIGSEFPLTPVMGIGRSASNTIVIDDDYVSNEHALLSLRGSQWWLEDLNSRNGTRLNNVLLNGPTVVTMGDIVTIGNSEFKLELK